MPEKSKMELIKDFFEGCPLLQNGRIVKKEHKLFQIISFADNRKGNLQHFKIEVSE